MMTLQILFLHSNLYALSFFKNRRHLSTYANEHIPFRPLICIPFVLTDRRWRPCKHRWSYCCPALKNVVGSWNTQTYTEYNCWHLLRQQAGVAATCNERKYFKSWFVQIAKLINKYQMPISEDLLKRLPPKHIWKFMMRQAFNQN